ncbi:hypothetical protein CEK25_006560 [Fusarium fujikuroi]|nr:hypothetical protein CEK25_006560 [Fusarium fujikuroi]
MYLTRLTSKRTVDVNCKVDVFCTGHPQSQACYPAGRPHCGHLLTLARSSDAGLGVYSASKFYSSKQRSGPAPQQALRLVTAGSGNVATDLLGGNVATDQEALKKYGEPTKKCRGPKPEEVL